jgi:TonB family protein
MKIMKTQLLGLSAAAFLVAASASTSVSATALSESQQYLQRVQPKADALLRAAGIGPQSQAVSVRARVAPDGRLGRIEVLRTSGSPDVDRAVTEVLRRLMATNAPLGLLDGAVTLNVGQGAVLQAEASR